MNLVKLTLFIAGLMLCSPAVHADIAQGKKLQEQNCTRCHDNSVYTRTNRQVNSLPALRQRINMCEKPAGVQWSQQQLMDVVNYLNKEFYHFK